MAVETIRGNLSTSGRLRANLAVGGGSEVTITPTYNSGTKIADYSIDGVPGKIYTPNTPEYIDLSNKTWTLLTSTTGTSAAVSIPDNTKYLAVIAKDNNNNKIAMVAFESLTNINKIMAVVNQNIYILGGYWKDQAGSDYGDTSCQINITDNTLTAYSSYHTNTTYIYAIS